MPYRLPLRLECVDAFGRFRLGEIRLKNFGFAALLGERLKIRSLGAVIGSLPESKSSGSFSVLEFEAGSILGLGLLTLFAVMTQLSAHCRSRIVRGENADKRRRVPAIDCLNAYLL